jgi:hypothetical protein
MRTTLDLPQTLLRKAQSILHTKTKTETLIVGLHQVLRRERIQGLLSMRGNFPINIDLKKSRKKIRIF